MIKRTGPLWEAMEAAVAVLDLNREGQRADVAYNADVTPVLDLARSIVEQCAAVADEHTQHEHASSAEFAEGYRQAAELIAAQLRAKVK